MPDPYNWLTITDAMDALQVSRATVYNMAAIPRRGQPELHIYRLGAKKSIPMIWLPELQKLVEARVLSGKQKR